MKRKPVVEEFKKKLSYSSSQEISREEVVKTVPNQFEMVLVVSARARDLARGARPLVECDNKFPVTAMREVAAGHIGRDYYFK